MNLSVNAAAKAIEEHKLARLSRSALNNIVLGYTATTRRSVLDAISRVTKTDADWLAGFAGPDMSPRELVARRIAAPGVREMGMAGWGERGRAQIEQRWVELQDEAYRAALTIVDLENWHRLLGDPLATFNEEERAEFAGSLGKALDIARKTGSPRRSRAGHELPRTFDGLKALERFLAGHGHEGDPLGRESH